MIQVGKKAGEKAYAILKILGPDWQFAVSEDAAHSWVGVFYLPDLTISCRPSDLKDISAEVLAERVKAMAEKAPKVAA